VRPACPSPASRCRRLRRRERHVAGVAVRGVGVRVDRDRLRARRAADGEDLPPEPVAGVRTGGAGQDRDDAAGGELVHVRVRDRDRQTGRAGRGRDAREQSVRRRRAERRTVQVVVVRAPVRPVRGLDQRVDRRHRRRVAVLAVPGEVDGDADGRLTVDEEVRRLVRVDRCGDAERRTLRLRAGGNVVELQRHRDLLAGEVVLPDVHRTGEPLLVRVAGVDVVRALLQTGEDREERMLEAEHELLRRHPLGHHVLPVGESHTGHRWLSFRFRFGKRRPRPRGRRRRVAGAGFEPATCAL
jgi:hypothetical protein